MSTISKISMSGYAPIADRKLNQKASNPISVNTQDSSSLNMSPNAHYAKHAVSFKAHTPLSFAEAEHFVSNFTFIPDMYLSNRGNNQNKVIHDTASKLLDIAIDHQDNPSLKKNALNRFLGLLNHEDPDVQKGTIGYIAEATGRECMLIKQKNEFANMHNQPELPYNSETCPHTSVVFELISHILPRLNTPPVDTIRGVFGEFYVANKTAGKVTEIINNCLKVKPQLLNSYDTRKYLFKNNDTFKHSLDIITNAGEGDPEFAKQFTPQCINKLIVPFLHSSPKEALPYLGRIAKVNSQFVTHDFINTHILSLPDNECAVAKLCAINDFAEANPRIVTHDLIKKTKSYLSSTDSYVRRNATRALSTFTKVNPEIATDERHDLISTAKNIFDNDNEDAYVRFEAKELIKVSEVMAMVKTLKNTSLSDESFSNIASFLHPKGSDIYENLCKNAIHRNPVPQRALPIIEAAPAKLESKRQYPMIEAAPAELESKRQYPIPESAHTNFESNNRSSIPEVPSAELESKISPRMSESASSTPKLRHRDRARKAIGALFHKKKDESKEPRTYSFFS